MNKYSLSLYFRYLILLSCCSLVACSTPITDYENTTPNFSLREFFSGNLQGWGLVKDYSNKVNKRFTVEMNANWDEQQGTLHEVFTYADGTQQERTWILKEHNDGRVSGTANDVTGTANGSINGFALNWEYELTIQVDGKDINVHLEDWIYQLDEHSVINQATIKKYGIPVGEVIVFILKQDVTT